MIIERPVLILNAKRIHLVLSLTNKITADILILLFFLAAVVSEITFQPKLATFEMDIMEEMGIKEERTPKRTYWY